MIRNTAPALSMLAACLLTAFGVAGFAGDSQAASPPTVNEKATRQLFQAVYANDLASARASVGNGADVDARDRWGMAPADIAIDRGNYGIAHFLVSIRNIRRDQEARATPAAPSPTAIVESPSTAASKRLAPVAAPASATAKPGGGTATPATTSTAGPLAGPNPFDPSTPAPGSLLLSSVEGAR